MHPTTLDDYQRTCDHAAAFDVSQRGKIEVTGPDAARFLHNLCTNDVKNLAEACRSGRRNRAKLAALGRAAAGRLGGDRAEPGPAHQP